MQVSDFCSSKKKKNSNNLKIIEKISGRFHKRAGTYTSKVKENIKKLDKELTIIEIAHQPNFLPHAGVLRKAVLSDYLLDQDTVSLFGFVDNDLSTSPWISQNRIPAMAKKGYKKIGFKLSGKEKWMVWGTIEKPSDEEWKAQINDIIKFYSKYSARESNLNLFEELMRESYNKGGSFSDVNAIFISLLCNKLWDLGTLFFLYSDLHRKKLFIDESKRVISNTEEYIKAYNDAIPKFNVNAKQIEKNFFPFWYKCDCNGKTSLIITSYEPLICEGTCVVCNKKHKLLLGTLDNPEIEKHYEKMSMKAVTRNLVFSEGLGTDIYVAGTGGGLEYGKMSNQVAGKLGISIPHTLVWKNKDDYPSIPLLYQGKSIKKILNGLEVKEKKSEINLKLKKLRKKIEKLRKIKRDLGKKYGETRSEDVMYEIKSTSKEEKKLIKKIQQYENNFNKIEIFETGLKVIPSILDLGISLGWEKLVDVWRESLNDGNLIIKDEFTILETYTYFQL